MRVVPTGRKRRILDFDIENRPITYWYDGNCTAEVTAIAWQWIGEEENPSVVCLGEKNTPELGDVLEAFIPVFSKADVVTGHYIRRHDLPILNAALIEQGMDILPSVETSDTKLDLPKLSALSVSQESLGELLGIDAPKVAMTQADWREANRLTPEGIELTKERVVGDIRQHVAIREELIRRGWLGPTSKWNSVRGGKVYVEQ